LNLVINADLERSFVVDTAVVFVNPIEIAQYVEAAASNNVSLLQVEQDMVISDYQIKSAKALLLPTIGLTGSYGWNRNENPASAFFPGTTNKSNSLALGANLRWNLFDGGRSITTIKNAKIVYENQELAKQQLEMQIHRDIRNAQGNYENALKIFDLQSQNVITSDDNLKRSSERLKLGQITSVEFRQAQINLINALTTKNAAKYQAKLAEVQLLQLAGQLLNVSY
jgi:outer membrane protein TolC